MTGKTDLPMVPKYLTVRGEHLFIEGFAHHALTEEFGSPLLVYSERQIENNLAEIQAAYSTHFPRFAIHYAAKACANRGVLDVIRRHGGSVEINSGGELHRVLQAGFRPDEIIFNGVAKSTMEIEQAVAAGLAAINVDSISELRRIAECCSRQARTANVALRVVPEVYGETVSGFETGHSCSKFGMVEGDLREAGALLQSHRDHLAFAGFHFHVGSQVTNASAFACGLKAVLGIASRFERQTRLRTATLNAGGGLPIPLITGPMPMNSNGSPLPAHIQRLLDPKVEPSEVARTMAETWDQLGNQVPLRHATQVLIEPGRRVVGNSAVLLVRVESAKIRPDGRRWLLLNAGFNLLPEILWYGWYYEVISASRAAEKPEAYFRLGGPLCDTGDSFLDERGSGLLPDGRLLPANTAVNDTLAILNTGAYVIEQMSTYNGHLKPAAIMIDRGGNIKHIRRRECYNDLTAYDLL